MLLSQRANFPSGYDPCPVLPALAHYIVLATLSLVYAPVHIKISIL